MQRHDSNVSRFLTPFAADISILVDVHLARAERPAFRVGDQSIIREPTRTELRNSGSSDVEYVIASTYQLRLPKVP